MNIVLASDNNGVEMMATAIYSVIKNNPGISKHFYIFESDITRLNKNCLKKLKNLSSDIKLSFIKVDPGMFRGLEVTRRDLTIQAYFRYLAPDLLPGEDRALYMDTDLLCIKPISAMYNINIKNYYIAGVEDFVVTHNIDGWKGYKTGIGLKNTDPYINTGLILMNLKRMRDDDVVNKFIESARNKNKIIPKKYNVFADQTIANLTFKDNIRVLPTKYNVLLRTIDTTKLQLKPAILHFAGEYKPFMYRHTDMWSYMDLYYEYFIEAAEITGISSSSLVKKSIKKNSLSTESHIEHLRERTHQLDAAISERDRIIIGLKNRLDFLHTPKGLLITVAGAVKRRIIQNRKVIETPNIATQDDVSRNVYFPYSSEQNKYIESMEEVLQKINMRPVRNKENAAYAWLHWYESIYDVTDWEKFLNQLIIKVDNLINLKQRGLKVVWNVHNKLPHDTPFPSASRVLMQILAILSDSIIIHSNATRKVIQFLSNDEEEVMKKILYIPHPNYIGSYGQASNQVPPKQKLKLLFLGAVKPYKNIEILIRVIKDLNFNDVELTICGNPASREYASKLKKLINNNKNIKVDFRFLPNNKVAEMIGQNHIIVLPYDVQSSLNSGAAMLAFSYHRTVLCPRIGTIEDINNKKIFFSYKYSNEQMHYEKLKKNIANIRSSYFDDYNKLLKLGEECYSYVEKYNNTDKVAQELKAVFVKEEL